ncbi:hypothetical protein [Bacillus cereus]|uniref:hypothetical protein n=1 Tax=Bacillus cereus TaxID=1396 RepID=UPI000BF609C4|nr:hypothetical protein [Bacillus cereus]PFA06621.1 hypothetical protein CN382_25780 [Bacillus cereus]
MKVYGEVNYGKDAMPYNIELPYEDITQSAMPIEQSTVLIVDAINKKYGTNYPYSVSLSVEFEEFKGLTVYGEVNYGKDAMPYSIELPYKDITQSAMPIEQSTALIVDAINKKYETNYPYSVFMSVEFK